MLALTYRFPSSDIWTIAIRLSLTHWFGIGYAEEHGGMAVSFGFGAFTFIHEGDGE